MTRPMTEAAARSLKRAAKLAQRADFDEFNAAHLLMAIILDESRAAEFLDTHGIRASSIAVEFDVTSDDDGQDESETTHELTDSQASDPTGDATISDILYEARHCKNRSRRADELSSEHLLWGVFAVDSPVSQWLKRNGIDNALLSELCDCQESRYGEPLGVDFEIQWDQSTEKPVDVTRDASLIRIVDAAANRVREGLRVLEDFTRFQLDDRELTSELKDVRHEVSTCIRSFDSAALLSARDTDGDVGVGLTTAAEAVRNTAADVVTANFKRVQEALRSLEEFGKFFSPELGGQFKQLRYRTYSLEKRVSDTFSTRPRISDARLYLLVTSADCRLDAEEVIRQAVRSGVDVVQVREKSMPDRELLEYLHRVRKITREGGVLLIVNDRPDLAVLCDADGVHVGQEELSATDVRRIVGPIRLVGMSTHSLEQARDAVQQGADYLGVGPVFPSQTKSFAEFAGLDFVREMAAEVSLPWFAIGGIDAKNIGEVLAAGANRIAVSGHICRDSEPATATGGLCDQFASSEPAV